jgi:adenylate cyclase
MSRSVTTIWIGLGAGLFGVILSILPLSLDLQEHYGLRLLFTLRGPRQPPPEVMIVTMDRESVESFHLSRKTQEWPRALHAQLVQTLTRKGAKLIVFDILFDADLDPATDRAFAQAVADSKRVILCAAIQREQLPITNASGKYLADLNIETVVPPIPGLAKAALAMAPFPRPKVPVQLSQFWLFKAGAGNLPTLPVVAFFIYSSAHYASFYHRFTQVHTHPEPALPARWDSLVAHGGIEKALTAFRETYNRDPSLARRMLDQLGQEDLRDGVSNEHHVLQGLIRMFQSSDSRFLNFYGPAGTIDTHSYHTLLGAQSDPVLATVDTTGSAELNGKVVFVGLSENLRPQRQDGYHTVFSKRNGVDLSGVEVAATAFANLLEDRPLTTLDWPVHRLMVFLFGCLLGVACCALPMGVATLAVTGISAAYLAAAVSSFTIWAIWLPVIVPIFILTPLALVGTVVCRYRAAKKERQTIRKAFGYYLPDAVIDQLAKNVGDLDANSQVLYGICLYTDAEQYAALSESMDPKSLSQLMNRYYAKLFIPVRTYGGIVSDVVGDAMMAIWAKSKPDGSLREAACEAAIGIAQAIRDFNRENPQFTLPTRIGMHAGHILVGNIGAVDHYEYRPVGDIVNTASRIEGMNRYLGTQTLVSDQVLHRLEGFSTRRLGRFLPFGKSNAVALHELLGHARDASDDQHELCRQFEAGLRAYHRQRWDEAIDAFDRTLSIYRADGPAIFFKRLCERFKKHPPAEGWDGLVMMDAK